VANDFNILYSIPATLTNTLTLTTIRAKITANKPIYSSVNWYGGGGHGVVIAWCDNTNDNLKIYDPSYGHDTYTRSDFLTSYIDGLGYWSQSIYWN
jgi:hypothetical protein